MQPPSIYHPLHPLPMCRSPASSAVAVLSLLPLVAAPSLLACVNSTLKMDPDLEYPDPVFGLN